MPPENLHIDVEDGDEDVEMAEGGGDLLDELMPDMLAIPTEMKGPKGDPTENIYKEFDPIAVSHIIPEVKAPSFPQSFSLLPSPIYIERATN